MSGPDLQLELLLEQAAAGDVASLSELLNGQRGSLIVFVSTRLDPRLSARFDPADIVQEALIEAACRFAEYITDRPVPFSTWLQQVATNRLYHVHREHIRAEKRSILRELVYATDGEAKSSGGPLEEARARGKSPSSFFARTELHEKLAATVAALPEEERLVLQLRFRDQLDVDQVAAKLGITRDNVRTRQLRALKHLRTILEDDENDFK